MNKFLKEVFSAVIARSPAVVSVDINTYLCMPMAFASGRHASLRRLSSIGWQEASSAIRDCLNERGMHISHAKSAVCPSREKKKKLNISVFVSSCFGSIDFSGAILNRQLERTSPFHGPTGEPGELHQMSSVEQQVRSGAVKLHLCSTFALAENCLPRSSFAQIVCATSLHRLQLLHDSAVLRVCL